MGTACIYPFSYMSKYARGTVMEEVYEGPSYDCSIAKNVPYVDTVTVYNEELGEIAIFAVNRAEETVSVSEELQGFVLEEIAEQLYMTSGNRKDTNLENHDKIKPYEINNAEIAGDNLNFEIEPLSWNMIRVKVKNKN